MKRFIIFILLCLAVAGTWFGLETRAKMKAREAAEKAAAEKKFEEVKVTLIEGWTNKEIFAALSKAGLGSENDFVQAQKNIDRSQYPFLISAPNEVDLEGYYFPDTYRFAKNATPGQILDTLLSIFEQRFSKAAEGAEMRAGYYILPGFPDLHVKGRVAPGLTLHEVVSLAAIVENETGRPGEAATSERLLEERKQVASVFLNRLSIGQALQSDATINYITNSGRSRSTAKDLEVDSPYNTYKYAGLPPGPISNPSLSSLTAVLHSIKNDYFYFLHNPSGEIYFGRTLEEHNENRRKYLN